MTNQTIDPTLGDGPAPLSIPDVLKIPNYRWLWLGQIVSNFGDSLTHFGLILLINEFTGGSTGAIAGLLIAFGLPMATVGLMAGVLVDRFPRRMVMILSDLSRAILVIAFILFALMGWQNIWFLYVVSFLHATVNSFFMPARQAITPNLVPEEGLMAANSLGQISMVIFRVMGTAAAGFLVGVLDAYWAVFTVDALTFVLSAFFISRIVLSESTKEAVGDLGQQVGQMFKEMGDGLSVIRSNRLLIGITVGFSAAMLGLGATNVLLPGVVINELQVAETWFGLIELAQASAMVISGLFVTALAARYKASNIIWIALLGTGLLMFGFVPLSQLWHLFPILFAVGLLMTPMQASSATIMQTVTDEEMLGRVGSVINAAIQTASLFSMFVAGMLAEWLGSRTVFLISALMLCGAAFLMGLIFRGQDIPSLSKSDINVSQQELQEAVS